MQRKVLIKANKRVKTLASLCLAYSKIKQYFTIPTRVSARLIYSKLQSIHNNLCLPLNKFIYYLKSKNKRQIYTNNLGFFKFLKDLKHMLP